MKLLITAYTFDASAQTITFTGYGSILLESVLLITNVTDNIIIYNFADTAKGGSASTNVLTLDYDTTTMDDADDLQIFYDDTAIETPLTDTEIRATALPVSGTVTADLGATDNAVLNAIDAVLDTIYTELQVKADPTETQEVAGDVAEDAAVGGNPVLTGGRYDASDRSLDSGDVGAIAITEEGFVKSEEVNIGLSGASADGSVTLVANTWTAIPSGTPPSVPYQLIITIETASPGVVRKSFDNGGTPGATNGNKWRDVDKDWGVVLAGDNVVYVASDATDDINWTTNII